MFKEYCQMMLIQSTAFETGLALIVYFHKCGGKLFFENYGLASLGGISHDLVILCFTWLSTPKSSDEQKGWPQGFHIVRRIGVGDTQSDSIQCLNFAKQLFIQYSIQYCFTQDSIQNIIQFKENFADSIQKTTQFNTQAIIFPRKIKFKNFDMA